MDVAALKARLEEHIERHKEILETCRWERHLWEKAVQHCAEQVEQLGSEARFEHANPFSVINATGEMDVRDAVLDLHDDPSWARVWPKINNLDEQTWGCALRFSEQRLKMWSSWHRHHSAQLDELKDGLRQVDKALGETEGSADVPFPGANYSYKPSAHVLNIMKAVCDHFERGDTWIDVLMRVNEKTDLIAHLEHPPDARKTLQRNVKEFKGWRKLPRKSHGPGGLRPLMLEIIRVYSQESG
jgi:hypothetical protein